MLSVISEFCILSSSQYLWLVIPRYIKALRSTLLSFAARCYGVLLGGRETALEGSDDKVV
jgi:hypothetical protein